MVGRFGTRGVGLAHLDAIGARCISIALDLAVLTQNTGEYT